MREATKEDIVVEDLESDSNSDYIETNYLKLKRQIDLRLVLVYALVYTLTQINKTNISNAAIVNLETGDGIRQQLNLDSGQWGWVISIFYYPYLFFEPPFTLLMKRFGPKIWQSRIIISWGAISILHSVCKNYSGLLAVRFFLGLSESSFYTSVLYHMSFWLKPRELPSRISFFYSFGMLSGAISGILSYGISYLNNHGNLKGWQWIFIFEGIPTVLMGFYCVLFLPNYIQDAKFLTQPEKNTLISKLPELSPSKLGDSFNWSEIKRLLKQPTFYSYTVIWLFQGCGGWGISFVLPTIIYELGFTDTAKTQLMTMPPSIFGFVLLNILGQLIQRRWIKAFPTAAILSGLQVVCYIILIAIDNSWAKYAMLILATGISNSLYPILWPDRIRLANGTSAAGLAIGWTNCVAQTMGLVGPQIYQPKFGPHYTVSYGCSIALCSISFIGILVTWWIVYQLGLLESEGAVAENDQSDQNEKELTTPTGETTT